jgi:YggT family protein
MIHLITKVLILIVIVHAILSWFLPTYNPARKLLDSIVEPMLFPIRKVIPYIGRFDISPLILIIIINALGNLLASALNF